MTPKPRRKKSNRWLIILAAVVVVLIIIAVFFKKDDSVLVTVETLERTTIISTVSEAGTVQPSIEVKIAPDVSGEIVELKFKEGDQVKKGDLLVTIRPDNYKSALQQAHAALNSIKANHLQAKATLAQSHAKFLQDSANYFRTDGLYKEKVVSQMEWENAKLQYDISKSQHESAHQSVKAAFYQMKSSEASLAQARQNLNKTNIYATMDGTVTMLNVELGERVVGTMQMQGTEIMRIADLSQMEIKVEINENDIVNIHIGDTAKIEVDAYEDKTFRGKVIEIAYSASLTGMGTSEQVTNFEVKVAIDRKSYMDEEVMREIVLKDKSPFRPGMSAQIEIFTEREENVLAVPIQAVTLRKEEKGAKDNDKEPEEIVYLLDDDNKVKIVAVKTGISDDKNIMIREGLSGGEQVITGPYLTLTKKLEEGMQVEIMSEEDEKEGKKKPWEN